MCSLLNKKYLLPDKYPVSLTHKCVGITERTYLHSIKVILTDLYFIDRWLNFSVLCRRIYI